MSLSNIIRIPLMLPNVDVYTFGESFLFAYDSLKECLIVHSFNDFNSSSIDYLHLSSSPKSSIRRLILNPDQTILALISDKTAYLVYLPQLNHLPSKGSRLCLLNVIPSLPGNASQTNNHLIDFLWLSSYHFVIVNSIPSSSECHLYIIRHTKHYQIEYLQTFSVGSSHSSSTAGKSRTSGTSKKRISLHQPTDIIHLDLTKRKQGQLILFLLFAMKSNGDIFIMEFEQNQLLNNENGLASEFVGPIPILPSTFDNYGADYSHSNLLCLSTPQNPIVLFTKNPYQINQSIVLNQSMNEYHLFTIDSITLSGNNSNHPMIKSMIINKLNSNIYYLYDSLSNVYSIEISWINQIDFKQKQISSTNIQHLIHSDHPIDHMGCIQTDNHGQFLAIITKTSNNQEKKLVLFRPNTLTVSSLTPTTSHSLSQSTRSNSSNVSPEFLDRIRAILTRNQSLPRLTLSSSSETNISDEDFQRNLQTYVTLFSEEYLRKQEKVQLEFKNRQRYLYDFEQTQMIAKEELDQKLQQIQTTYQILNEKYQQEYSRHQHLLTKLGDLLSVIEQQTSTVSRAEILMRQQLQRYETQVNSLKEKITLLQRYITQQQSRNQTQQKPKQSSMKDINGFLQYYKNEIAKMKEKLHTVDQKN